MLTWQCLTHVLLERYSCHCRLFNVIPNEIYATYEQNETLLCVYDMEFFWSLLDSFQWRPCLVHVPPMKGDRQGVSFAHFWPVLEVVWNLSRSKLHQYPSSSIRYGCFVSVNLSVLMECLLTSSVCI